MRTPHVCALIIWLLAGPAGRARAHDDHERGPRSTSERYPFAPGSEHADDLAPHETSGPALLVGAGDLYAGLGVRAAYYLTIKERPLSFAPHVGAGYTLGVSALPASPGARGGVTLAYGRSRRWIADLAYGALHGHQLRLHGLPTATRAIHGASLALGFEAIDRFGVIAHALLGAHVLTSRGVASDDRLGITFGLGIGWKPW